jgi:hypothetical protein
VTKWKTCVCLVLLVCPAGAGATEDKPAVPVYTNEDLERVHPFRDETGVASVPAFPSGERPGRSAPGPEAAGVRARGRSADRHTEAYWRAEAERVRGQVRQLEALADDLRHRLGAARSEPWSSRRRRAAPDASGWQARLAAVERLRHDVEADFLDRARRAGALPGWLR